MWIRGTQCKKLRPPTQEDKAHGKGRGQSDEYWVKRIHAAIGDDLLRLKFISVYAGGLFRPQIAATLTLTFKGNEVAEGKQRWCIYSRPAITDEGNHLHPKKKPRKSGGSNLMPIIESLLSSSSNWYEISETSQYQYPGVFQDNQAAEVPPLLGHVPDITKLPHFTGQNHHLLYNENQLSKGHYNDNPRSVTIDGKERKVRIRYAACQGVLQCSQKGCTYTASKRAKQCPKHPSVSLVSTSDCPVYVVYVYPADEQNNYERWITGVTKDKKTNMSSFNLHNHALPVASKVPTIVQDAVKQAVHSNPGLTSSQMDLGNWKYYWLLLHVS